MHTAADAKEALRALDGQAVPFDGVFLDIQMPGTTGIELCSIIRGTPGYADVPIIMLTAMTERPFLERAFARGANNYLTKPFELDDIRETLARERLLSRQRAHLKDAPMVPGRPQADGTSEVIRSLEDAISVSSVERCVLRDAFQTYILQSRARYGTQLTLRAIKIAGVFDLFSQLPNGEYQKIVHEMARVLSDLTAPSNDVLTHLGNGIFLSACVGKSALTNEALSRKLEKNEVFAKLEAFGLTLCVILGDPTPLKGESNADVIFQIARAIESAEQSEESLSSWGSFREWFSFRRSTGREKSRIDKSAYEQILNEFISEGELGWK